MERKREEGSLLLHVLLAGFGGACAVVGAVVFGNAAVPHWFGVFVVVFGVVGSLCFVGALAMAIARERWFQRLRDWLAWRSRRPSARDLREQCRELGDEIGQFYEDYRAVENAVDAWLVKQDPPSCVLPIDLTDPSMRDHSALHRYRQLYLEDVIFCVSEGMRRGWLDAEAEDLRCAYGHDPRVIDRTSQSLLAMAAHERRRIPKWKRENPSPSTKP